MYTAVLVHAGSPDVQRRSRLAVKHHAEMIARYGRQTLDSANDTTIITEDTVLTHHDTIWATKSELLRLDTVSALTVAKGRNVCVLNFASYKRPGGGFLKGALAQEESLCHKSNLFEILETFKDSFYEDNRRNLNENMYLNRMLYIPGVIFQTPTGDRSVNVISCAAPNRGASDVPDAVNTACLKSRIDAMFTLAELKKVDVFIVGAWGCGVFGQDPTEVAQLMYNRARHYSGGRIIFAVPDSRAPNYQAFRKVIPA